MAWRSFRELRNATRAASADRNQAKRPLAQTNTNKTVKGRLDINRRPFTCIVSFYRHNRATGGRGVDRREPGRYNDVVTGQRKNVRARATAGNRCRR